MSETEVVALLQQRRADELARFADVCLARDVLEKQTAVQLAALAKERAQVAKLELRIKSLEQRAGSRRFSQAKDEDGGSTNPKSRRPRWFHRTRERLWWNDTLRRARREHKQGHLLNAQLLFDAALVVRCTQETLTELAHVLREQKLYEDAEKAYGEVLKHDQQNGLALFFAGYCAEHSGAKARAIKYYEQALTTDPSLSSRFDHLNGFRDRLEA